MADNWSSSVTTLTNAGDWAKWTITLGSGDAADLNNTTGTSTQFLALRYAMSAASRQGYYALVINDVVGEGIFFSPPSADVVSSAGWTSAGRFRGGPAGIGSFGGFGFPIDSLTEAAFEISSAAFASGPWVAGTNTVRFLWLGRFPDGAAEPVEIDFISIQTGSGFGIIDDWGNFGNDAGVAGADLKPVTGTPPGYTGYDDLGAGAQIAPGGHKSTWLLRGDAPSTGTAADTILEVIKFCPVGGSVEATIRVTGAGDPVAGTVGVLAAGTATLATLDGNGEATFTIPAGEDADFWYGGNDDWTPAAVSILDTDRIGCHGWHVGYIAMAS